MMLIADGTLRRTEIMLSKKHKHSKGNVAKSSRKKLTDASPDTSVFLKLEWNGYRWYSTGRNWRSEYQKRVERNLPNPFVNPVTACYYSVQAQNYRERFIVFEKLES